MINITEKYDCCGCSACVQRCPRHCISLKEDKEGFLYPHVDQESCIDCGLCEKVCPWLNIPDKISPIEVLAAKNRNEKERMASSSGGIFIALAKRVIGEGGVVFGAVFDENWEVMHTYAETLEDVLPMMGSKYLQSRIGNCFVQAENFLKVGRKVMFVGTPCQITALHNFLRKDYPNLLSVDFLCHGVPSPGVWRKYLDETIFNSARMADAGKNSVLPMSLNKKPEISGISFRDKEVYGWEKFSFVVCMSASKADKNSVLLSDMHRENPYMRGFLSNIYLRPSCYICKCKNGVSHSDMTIGDYWGVNVIMPEFDDDKGVSIVLLNTEKGRNLFRALDMDVRNASIDAAKQYNGGFKDAISIPMTREKFFHYFGQDRFAVSVRRALFVPIWKKVYNRLRRWIKL